MINKPFDVSFLKEYSNPQSDNSFQKVPRYSGFKFLYTSQASRKRASVIFSRFLCFPRILITCEASLWGSFWSDVRLSSWDIEYLTLLHRILSNSLIFELSLLQRDETFRRPHELWALQTHLQLFSTYSAIWNAKVKLCRLSFGVNLLKSNASGK